MFLKHYFSMFLKRNIMFFKQSFGVLGGQKGTPGGLREVILCKQFLTV